VVLVSGENQLPERQWDIAFSPSSMADHGGLALVFCKHLVEVSSEALGAWRFLCDGFLNYKLLFVSHWLSLMNGLNKSLDMCPLYI
jgi:hypothetical protein